MVTRPKSSVYVAAAVTSKTFQPVTQAVAEIAFATAAKAATTKQKSRSSDDDKELIFFKEFLRLFKPCTRFVAFDNEDYSD